MKTHYFTILISFLFSIYSLSTSAQNSYEPLLDETAIWNFDRTIECEPYTPYYHFQYSLVLSGDTSINGVEYQKLVRPAWEFSKPDWFEGTVEDCNDSSRPATGYLGALREDVNNQKVYFIATEESEEMLLYDFTMETGDTLNSYYPVWILNGDDPFIVESVDSVLINGSHHLRWNIQYESMPDDAQRIQIIEGIGGLHGLIDPDPFFLIHSSVTELMCYSNADGDLYPSDAGPCNLITDIEEMMSSEDQIVVFPNPARDHLSLQLPENLNHPSAVIQISDLTGRMVWEQRNSVAPQIVISTTEWSPGLYLVRLSSKGLEYSEKFVVQ